MSADPAISKLAETSEVGTTLPSLRGALSEVVGLPSLYERWLLVRGPIAVLAIVLGVALGWLQNWAGALPVAGLGTILLADVWLRHKGLVLSPATAIFLDTTLMGLAILVLHPPASVVSMPFTYLVATTFLLVPWRRASTLAFYQLIWMSVLLMAPVAGLWTPITGTQSMIIAAIMSVLFVGALVSVFGHAGAALGAVRTSLTRRFEYEEALALCSQALLMGSDEAAVQPAISALLTVSGADAVYVDRNFEDPVKGLCTRIVHEVIRDGTPQPDPEDAWNGSAYSELPTSHSDLSRGRPSMIHTRDLQGEERGIYERDGVQSELDIPIFSRGTWLGSIAFATYTGERQWDEEDVALLQTAAEMVGVFWSRRVTQQNLEAAIKRLDHRFVLEQALARSARALMSTAATPLVTALHELLAATGADFVFVDENYLDPTRGLCTRIVGHAEKPGSNPVDAPEEWWGGAYDDLPTSYAALSRGRPSIIKTCDLIGPERKLYEDDGLLSELCLPISVNGEWKGSIAFTDYQIARQWSDSDIVFLETAADLIGAYWARAESNSRLESAIKSLDKRVHYEESLARFSQELLTDSPGAMETAFHQLMRGTDVDYIWLDENYEHPVKGFSARIVCDTDPHDPTNAPEDTWLDGPHSETPTSYAHLSRGEPSVIRIKELTGHERELYEADGLESELMIPIYVFGDWYGSVGFADDSLDRQWEAQDLHMLRTAAQMIGSFLERRQTRARLEELVRSKDEFIASVSHEIRTPLTSVLGFTDILTSGDTEVDANERRELLGLIGREAQEVSWIVEDLLAFARADIGTLAATAVPLSPFEQTHAVLAGQPPELVERVTVEDSLHRALADPGRVRQIMRNLLTNAFRYGGPEVSVAIEEQDGVVATYVTDNGNGIPEDQRTLIFDAYHSAHERGGQPGSVGLGLNVSRKLARVMGGDLTYSYEDGHSIFCLSLPLAELPIAVS